MEGSKNPPQFRSKNHQKPSPKTITPNRVQPVSCSDLSSLKPRFPEFHLLFSLKTTANLKSVHITFHNIFTMQKQSSFDTSNLPSKSDKQICDSSARKSEKFLVLTIKARDSKSALRISKLKNVCLRVLF